MTQPVNFISHQDLQRYHQIAQGNEGGIVEKIQSELDGKIHINRSESTASVICELAPNRKVKIEITWVGHENDLTKALAERLLRVTDIANAAGIGTPDADYQSMTLKRDKDLELTPIRSARVVEKYDLDKIEEEISKLQELDREDTDESIQKKVRMLQKIKDINSIVTDLFRRNVSQNPVESRTEDESDDEEELVRNLPSRRPITSEESQGNHDVTETEVTSSGSYIENVLGE